MDDIIEITRDIDVDRPVFVVALQGWVDAGSAGEGAVEYLVERLDNPVEVARIDLTELSDLQQARPTVRLVDGVTRELVWPSITFTAGRAGVDVVVCRGPEPSIRWRTFAAETVELARSCGARSIVTLGGMPAATSHRRPMKTLATATSRSLAQEVEPVRPDYVGPTGAQTAIQVAAGAAAIGGLALWAQVPHYLSGTVSPVAARSLLSRLREIAGVEVDLRPLDAQANSYDRQVENTVTARADLAELVDRLDAQIEDIPSGDELASEIEEFLREES